MVKIAPSLASANQSNLASAIEMAEAGGADLLHFDLEDGVFIPNLTFGPRTIRDLRPLSRLPFDVHLELHQRRHSCRKSSRRAPISSRSSSNRHDTHIAPWLC
jgi:pentose-5-phosphate-3-epimerase